MLLAENKDSQLVTEYVNEGFVPLAKIKDSRIETYHTDYLGTPKEVTDESGAVVWQGNYDEYGKVSAVKNETEQNIRFQGQYEDAETGLFYNRFRYYDADGCRYINQDPIKIECGLNIYSYVDNPTVWLDPLGLYKVYRLLRPDESPASGLSAKKPGRGMTPHGHLSSGSRKNFKGSQYISTSTDPNALTKWRQPGQTMVSFDTNDVVADIAGNRSIRDISSFDKARAEGIGSVSAKFSADSKEVLVEGHVPPQAIKEC